MPYRAKKPCAHPGCPAAVGADERYCEKHRADAEQYARDYDRRRGSAAKRGYGARWRRYRAWFLSRPENALCADCKRHGRLTPATVVDHITPVEGPDDPLFWEPTNHQGLCDHCHNVKRATEDKAKHAGHRQKSC